MRLPGAALALLAALAAGRARPAPRPADAAPPGAAGPPAVLPVRVPGGVGDASGTVVLVRTPEGGLDAVDAATGASRWRLAGPARALLVASGTAYLLTSVAPGVLGVAAHDLDTGRSAALWPLPPESLPAWATLVEPSGGRVRTTVSASARLAGTILEVGLEAGQVTLGGMGLLPGPEARAVLRVEVATGAVALAPGARLSPPPLAAPAPPGAPRLVRFHARVPDERVMLGGPPPDVEGVLVADGGLVGFERTPGKVVVHFWSLPGGARRAPVELRAETDAIWPTLDRRHVALRRAADQRRVDVFPLDGGPAIATLEGAVEIAILAGRVFWTRWTEGEVELVALSPGPARSLWRRTLVPREGPPGAPIP